MTPTPLSHLTYAKFSNSVLEFLNGMYFRYMTMLDFVGFLASLATIGMFASSTGVCLKILKTRSTGTVAYLPFITGVINCVLWLSYGYSKGDATIFFVNFVGLLLNLMYIVVYTAFSDKKNEVLNRCGLSAVVVLAVFAYYFCIETDNSRGITILGLMCNAFAIAFFASPLASIKEVLKSKNTETMSLPLSTTAAVVTMLWVMYGILSTDIYVVFPNFLGFVLTVIQLSLFVLYWNTPRKKIVSLEKPV